MIHMGGWWRSRCRERFTGVGMCVCARVRVRLGACVDASNDEVCVCVCACFVCVLCVFVCIRNYSMLAKVGMKPLYSRALSHARAATARTQMRPWRRL